VLAGGVLMAVVLRALLLPMRGLVGDLDQFVLWTHGLVVAPFGRAYDQNISFPPVMVYIWGVLAAIQPGFRTVVDSADPAIRAFMKTPASIADIAITLGVAYALRSRSRWAVIGALGIALNPAVIDVSAWWGQYESIYLLGALIAYLLAVSGRNGLAAIALAIALMTKPQAAPFLVPFAAWVLARDGWRGALRAAGIGAGTVVVLWAPFVAAGGPAAYLRSVTTYQNEIFSVLSLRAWNPWWILQIVAGGGDFIRDAVPIVGPATLRWVGYVVAGLLELAVFLAVRRRPTPEILAWGLAAAVLVAFTTLTTMHERYAYGALVFLALLLPDRRALVLWIAFSIVFTLNLLAAIPPTPEIGSILPVGGPLGIVGSISMTAISVATLLVLVRESRGRPSGAPDAAGEPPERTSETAPEGQQVPAQVVG